MKNFGILFVFCLLTLGACKNDGADNTESTVTAVTPSTPSASMGLSGEPNKAVPTSNPMVSAEEPAVPAGPITTIEFEEVEYDYGMVMEGEKVVHEYKFKNTGDEPLIISNAKGSCGCTVPDWPREPIAPGESNVIKVQFDSKNKGKVGGAPQSKRVTITANTDPVNSYLTIKGKVDKVEVAEPAATDPS